MNKKIAKERKRKVKTILYESNEIKYEEIINKIMNKSHLKFVVDYESHRNEKYQIYVEEKISCYDNYITHLNTNSYIIFGFNNYSEVHYTSNGILIGSKEKDFLFSFKYYDQEECGECEVVINKEGKILIPCYDEIDECSIKTIKIMEMKKTEEEIRKEKEEEEENKRTNKMDRYSTMVISKYFNTVNDYINMEKTNKKYNGIIEQFPYNPIPLKNEKEREIFKNIQTYSFYEQERNEEKDVFEEEKRIIKKDSRIKQCLYWDVSYSYWKENKRENDEYKNIEYGEKDMKKLLFDHDENGDWDSKNIYLKTEKVTLEEGMTSIGENCFCSCINLKEITIPTTVKSIGRWCFRSCSNLSRIDIPTSVTSIEEECFAYCYNLSTINIPSSISKIVGFCFEQCSHLCTVNIPTSVTSIGGFCFYSCSNLSTINIPSSVKSIGVGCFGSCSNLSTINIPTSVTSIESRCFERCENLSSITIPTSISSIEKECFSECYSLSTITIPSTVTSVKQSCFNECSNLKDIEIEEGNQTIYKEGNIIIEKETNKLIHLIGCYQMNEITIPTSVKSIEDECFSECSNLKTITIPLSVSSIGKHCFRGCRHLSRISIPSSVISIGHNCFYQCNKLKGNITIDSNNPTYKIDGTSIRRKDNNEWLYNNFE